MLIIEHVCDKLISSIDITIKNIMRFKTIQDYYIILFVIMQIML